MQIRLAVEPKESRFIRLLLVAPTFFHFCRPSQNKQKQKLGRHLRAGLFRGPCRDRVQRRQVQPVERQVLQQVQDGGRHVRRLAQPRTSAHQQPRPVAAATARREARPAHRRATIATNMHLDIGRFDAFQSAAVLLPPKTSFARANGEVRPRGSSEKDASNTYRTLGMRLVLSTS